MTKEQIRRRKQSKNRNEWKRTHTKTISILLHNENDKDIILYLSSAKNKNGLLKSIIRKHMKNNKIVMF